MYPKNYYWEKCETNALSVSSSFVSEEKTKVFYQAAALKYCTIVQQSSTQKYQIQSSMLKHSPTLALILEFIFVFTEIL